MYKLSQKNQDLGEALKLIILIFAMIGFIVVYRWINPCNIKSNCDSSYNYNVAENQW